MEDSIGGSVVKIGGARDAAAMMGAPEFAQAQPPQAGHPPCLWAAGCPGWEVVFWVEPPCETPASVAHASPGYLAVLSGTAAPGHDEA